MNVREHAALAKPANTPDCDCTVRCGDDPWLKTGKAQPCDTMLASQEHDRILTQQVALISQLRKTYGADSVITLLEKMNAEIARLDAVQRSLFQQRGDLPVAPEKAHFADLARQHLLHMHPPGSQLQYAAIDSFARAVLVQRP